jgi:hypothetical protein
MPHPLIQQLRFTRSEFQRAIANVSDEDANHRIGPMNCIAWNVGHLAWQEQAYLLLPGQERMLFPDIDEQFVTGAPAREPALSKMWVAWRAITNELDPWLDALTSSDLAEPRQFSIGVHTIPFTIGTNIQRITYHYWYHCGENRAIRQLLGHTNLPEFVGDIDSKAPYRPEDVTN